MADTSFFKRVEKKYFYDRCTERKVSGTDRAIHERR